MSYLVCHMQKATRGNVSGLQRHNQRENKNYGNEQVDLNKSHLNYDLQNQQRINHLKTIDEIIKSQRTSDKAIRKDAIVEVNTVIGSDKDFFNKLSDQERDRFFKESYEYLKEKVGEKNVVSSIVHLDETTPHMHFSFVPMNEDGTLSAKKKINRNFLREIQDEFPRHMKERGFDIERGMENSTKKHLKDLDYKKQEIKKDIEKARQQQETFKEKYAAMKENIKTKAEDIQKASEKLSKIEEHIKGVTGKLDRIEVKKGLFSDKLTISEQDYSTLVNLAKAGEGKYLENLQLKAKVGNLEEQLERAKNTKSLEEHRKDIRIHQLEGVKDKYMELSEAHEKMDRNFNLLKKAVRNLGEETVEKVNTEIKAINRAEKAQSIAKPKSRSFDMER